MKRADFFKQWQIDRYADIATYRDKCFASAETGTMGVKLKMPWIDFKDDSTEAFFDGLESSSEEQQEEKSKNDEPLDNEYMDWKLLEEVFIRLLLKDLLDWIQRPN